MLMANKIQRWLHCCQQPSVFAGCKKSGDDGIMDFADRLAIAMQYAKLNQPQLEERIKHIAMVCQSLPDYAVGIDTLTPLVV